MKSLIYTCNPAFKSIFESEDTPIYLGLSTKLFDLYQFKPLFAKNYRIYDSTSNVKYEDDDGDDPIQMKLSLLDILLVVNSSDF